MPLTIATLLRQPGLDITPTGSADLSRQLTWVYASELPDPTRWLDGGELILTAALWLRARQTTPDAYVRRLVTAGAAGVGVAVGATTPQLHSYRSVPAALVAAGNRHDLPILELPPQTTFIAVSKAISNALAAEAHVAVLQAYEAQRSLARLAVQQDGVRRLVRELSRQLAAWVLVLDARGETIAATEAAVPHAHRVIDEVGAAAKDGRADVLTLATEGEHLIVYRLRSGARIRGMLAVGSAERLSVERQHVANVAAALLTLLLERAQSIDAFEERVRARIARALLDGDADLAAHLADAVDIALPAGRLQVVALLAHHPRDEWYWQALLESMAAPVLSIREDDRTLLVLAADDHSDDTIRIASQRAPEIAVGVSGPVPFAAAATARRQAMAAAGEALDSGRPTLRYADLPSRRLLDAIPASEAHEFAKALLAPLLQQDADKGTELVRTLRAWLAHHGQWDPTATELGVHRHTLRNRITRIERMTGRPLHSVTQRMEFWAALELAER